MFIHLRPERSTGGIKVTGAWPIRSESLRLGVGKKKKVQVITRRGSAEAPGSRRVLGKLRTPRDPCVWEEWGGFLDGGLTWRSSKIGAGLCQGQKGAKRCEGISGTGNRLNQV